MATKRVITRVVIDIGSGAVEELQGYDYDGPWALATSNPGIVDDDRWGDIVNPIRSAGLAAGIETSARALSTQVAIATVKLDQSENAANLFRTIDEYHDWAPVNRGPPFVLPGTEYQPLPWNLSLRDPEEIPAGLLFGQPEELPPYPVPPVTSPPWPDPNLTSWPSIEVWLFDVQEPAGSFFGQPDEDLPWPWRTLSGPPWPAPNATAYQATQQWTADVQEPAGALFGQPDEDFLFSQVGRAPPWPQPASLFQPLPYRIGSDSEDLPVADFFGQPDEDLPWPRATTSGPPWPVPATLSQPLPYRAGSDSEDLPVADFFGQPDEDFLQAPNTGAPFAKGAELYQRLPYPWTDAEDLPVTDFFGQPDEDLPWPWPTLSGPPWPLPLTTTQQSINQWATDVQEPAGTLFGQPDEDFWALRPPAPQPLTFQPLYQIATDEPLTVAATNALDDSGAPQVPQPPLVASAQVYLPDPEEIPASLLHGQPDEDLPPPLPSPVSVGNLLVGFVDDAAPPQVFDSDDFPPVVQPPAPVSSPVPLVADDPPPQMFDADDTLIPPATQSAIAVVQPALALEEDLPQTPIAPVFDCDDRAPVVPQRTRWNAVTTWLWDALDSVVQVLPKPPPFARVGGSSSSAQSAQASQAQPSSSAPSTATQPGAPNTQSNSGSATVVQLPGSGPTKVG